MVDVGVSPKVHLARQLGGFLRLLDRRDMTSQDLRPSSILSRSHPRSCAFADVPTRY